MVWGLFAWSGVGRLVHIKRIMTADVYIDLLNEHLEVSLLKSGLEINCGFNKTTTPDIRPKNNCVLQIKAN